MSNSRQARRRADLALIDEAASGVELRMEAAYRFAHADTSPRHSHPLGHLVHAATGVLSLLTDGGAWIAPGNRFAWVPAGFDHQHRAHGFADVRIVHLDEALASELPSSPAVLVASDLAREAVLAMTSARPRSASALQHLREVVVDEVTTAPEQPLHLPEPHDPRLCAALRAVESEMVTGLSLEELGERVGCGARTLSRLFRAETGMGYRQWRLQLRVHRALVLLANGTSVTDAATQCGWSSTSQFIDQFTPLVGMTPGRYRQSS